MRMGEVRVRKDELMRKDGAQRSCDLASWLGLKSTMDNMDDHPSSSIGLEGVCVVIHGSSGGPWMVVWTV